MLYRCTARAAGMILSRDSAMVQLSGLLCLVPLVLDSAALQARVAERCLPIILLALQQHMEEEEVVSKSLILLGVLGQVRRQLRPALGRLAAAACAACPVCGGRGPCRCRTRLAWRLTAGCALQLCLPAQLPACRQRLAPLGTHSTPPPVLLAGRRRGTRAAAPNRDGAHALPAPRGPSAAGVRWCQVRWAGGRAGTALRRQSGLQGLQ